MKRILFFISFLALSIPALSMGSSSKNQMTKKEYNFKTLKTESIVDIVTTGEQPNIKSLPAVQAHTRLIFIMLSNLPKRDTSSKKLISSAREAAFKFAKTLLKRNTLMTTALIQQINERTKKVTTWTTTGITKQITDRYIDPALTDVDIRGYFQPAKKISRIETVMTELYSFYHVTYGLKQLQDCIKEIAGKLGSENRHTILEQIGLSNKRIETALNGLNDKFKTMQKMVANKASLDNEFADQIIEDIIFKQIERTILNITPKKIVIAQPQLKKQALKKTKLETKKDVKQKKTISVKKVVQSEEEKAESLLDEDDSSDDDVLIED